MSIQAYQTNSVETASPGELTLMLYNGCIKFIRAGRKAVEQNNIEQKNIMIQKAQAIILELMVTMDQQYEVANEILPLYEYIHHLLIEANTKNDGALLEEAERLVIEFRDTWKQVLLQSRKLQHGTGGTA
ncbi:flagellar export chaperone FliS [Halobacillus massiliensis]|uniref:flagellar export chaperone FliS n=1 Tax=Halobacillus massiliensis TaxID=1926286 RepID=UPI0009E358DD|nr:flagellar export chaperone FliS [Halobacillus massiliensis]